MRPHPSRGALIRHAGPDSSCGALLHPVGPCLILRGPDAFRGALVRLAEFWLVPRAAGPDPFRGALIHLLGLCPSRGISFRPAGP